MQRPKHRISCLRGALQDDPQQTKPSHKGDDARARRRVGDGRRDGARPNWDVYDVKQRDPNRAQSQGRRLRVRRWPTHKSSTPDLLLYSSAAVARAFMARSNPEISRRRAIASAE